MLKRVKLEASLNGPATKYGVLFATEVFGRKIRFQVPVARPVWHAFTKIWVRAIVVYLAWAAFFFAVGCVGVEHYGSPKIAPQVDGSIKITWWDIAWMVKQAAMVALLIAVLLTSYVYRRELWTLCRLAFHGYAKGVKKSVP